MYTPSSIRTWGEVMFDRKCNTCHKIPVLEARLSNVNKRIELLIGRIEQLEDTFSQFINTVSTPEANEEMTSPDASGIPQDIRNRVPGLG